MAVTPTIHLRLTIALGSDDSHVIEIDDDELIDRLILAHLATDDVDPKLMATLLRMFAEGLVAADPVQVKKLLVKSLRSAAGEAEDDNARIYPDDPDFDMRPTEDLDLRKRTYNVLKKGGIIKIGTLLAMSEDDLLGVWNFGRESLDEVTTALKGMELFERSALNPDRAQVNAGL